MSRPGAADALAFMREIDDAMRDSFDGPGTAELLDEADEDGTVVVKDRHGHARYFMPREDYESLRAEAAK